MSKDINFPAPTPSETEVKKPKIKKWLGILSHVGAFIAGLLGSEKAAEVIQKGSEILEGLSK